MMRKFDKRILAAFLVSFALFQFFGCKSAGRPPLARHVLLIGIDGMGAEGFQLAKTPHLKELAKQGALSIKARSVMPTVSSPSWGSILTGAGPEQHGMTSNAWLLSNYTIEPTAKDADGYFPSIFTLLRQNRPDAEIAVFYDWDGLGNLFNHKYLNRVELTKNYHETFEKAVPYILEKKPQLVFLYIGNPDEVGHEHGFDSEEYYQSLEQVDAKLGDLFAALKRAGLYEETEIIIVADHGGIGTGHGGESMLELEVPWIIHGPGVIKDRMVAQPVNIYDTASTIAYLFHLEQPYEWIGRPVLGAFEANKALTAKNVETFQPKPKSSLRSGLYAEPKWVSFSVDDEGALIRLTLDGTEPDPDSPPYEKPLLLEESTIVKARAMKDGAKSALSIIRFFRVKGVKEVRLKNEPNEKYPAEGSLSLVDGKRGKPDYKDPAWLGFEKDDLEAVLDFGEPRPVHKIGLECLEDRESYIFQPTQLEYAVSEDGKKFVVIGLVREDEIKKKGPGAILLIEKNFKDIKARFLRVTARSRGKVPPGLPGAGEKAWLFVDEIIVD
jgi:hypothetical protein